MTTIKYETSSDVVEAREGIYGHPYDNFANIAGLWSVYLTGRQLMHFTTELSKEDVAHMMILLKVARTIHGGKDPDTIVDIAGYARCIQLIREKENAQS
jgi:hypothetical protein